MDFLPHNGQDDSEILEENGYEDHPEPKPPCVHCIRGREYVTTYQVIIFQIFGNVLANFDVFW